ncbi:MAG: BamA/TamA family outer membrane protein [Chitinophagaceae bacterium]|nr:BamA/TamA family outer membrane protein [Chitinophagaceae bacterium]
MTSDFVIMNVSFLSTLIVILFSISCVVPRKYKANKPFVIKTSINIQGNLNATEKADLKVGLENQLDDSLKVRLVSQAAIRKTLRNPPVFDTNYVNRSIIYMNALMNSKGFYKSAITWDSTLRKVGDQQRVTVNFNVVTGKQLRLDSMAFALNDSALQEIAVGQKDKSILKRGEPYSKQAVSSEIDRLVELFKNHGYFRISREDMYAEVDTVVAALINPFLDPLEQIALLEEVRRKRENPTINVTIRQRLKPGTSHLTIFYVRNVSIFPELRLTEDSLSGGYDSTVRNGIKVYSKARVFKPSFVVSHTELKPGELYQQERYYKTVNNYYKMGAWQTVAVNLFPDDSAAKLDVSIKLYPAKKQIWIAEMEASRNTGDVVATSNLFGFGLNLGFRNLNVAREAIETSTNARFGIELGSRSQLIQTTQVSLTHDIIIPKALIFFTRRNKEKAVASRTILNFNGSWTDRQKFFTLGSLNGSIGFEYNYKKHSLRVIPFNIELVRLGTTDSLDKLLNSIPNLRFSFNNGMIISQKIIYTANFEKKDRGTLLKVGIEESGALAGLSRYIDRESGLYRFLKLDAELTRRISFPRHGWAFRAYGGVGIPYGRQRNGEVEPSLPFFKSFVAGGPNSMRAWQVRRLGVGSNNYFDTLNNQGGSDRYGDIQLEGNVEFRFNLATVAGLKIKSALFTDIGNIWYRSSSSRAELQNSWFRLNKLYRDLAVAAGTGLRFDFDYFLVRFDWAYKVKDPLFYKENDGWLHNIKIGSGQFQLGINYPF